MVDCVWLAQGCPQLHTQGLEGGRSDEEESQGEGFSPVETCASATSLLAKEWRSSRIVLDMLVLTSASQDPGPLRNDEKEMLAGAAPRMALTPLGLIVELVLFVPMTTGERGDRSG